MYLAAQGAFTIWRETDIRSRLTHPGDDGLTEYNWRMATQPPSRRSATTTEQHRSAQEMALSNDILHHFRIYFPTKETVLASRGGDGVRATSIPALSSVSDLLGSPAHADAAKAGGTICLQAKWYDAATFPKDLFRDCVSRRTGLLMHNKVSLRSHGRTMGLLMELQALFARPQPTHLADNGECAPAWAYVGSANLSESAW